MLTYVIKTAGSYDEEAEIIKVIKCSSPYDMYLYFNEHFDRKHYYYEQLPKAIVICSESIPKKETPKLGDIWALEDGTHVLLVPECPVNYPENRKYENIRKKLGIYFFAYQFNKLDSLESPLMVKIAEAPYGEE